MSRKNIRRLLTLARRNKTSPLQYSKAHLIVKEGRKKKFVHFGKYFKRFLRAQEFHRLTVRCVFFFLSFSSRCASLANHSRNITVAAYGMVATGIIPFVSYIHARKQFHHRASEYLFLQVFFLHFYAFFIAIKGGSRDLWESFACDMPTASSE